ncbi:MAG: hypothetical protein HY527_16110 [Betaproteobacteria bacterium]|nr:hypothetical protein [Betaproteobacteria bacterium]
MIMWREKDDPVETLLRRDVRADLPFGRLLQLYLDPSALFKDASRGSAEARKQARRYNRAMRGVLLPYIRRWITIAVLFFLSIAPVEALGAQKSAFVILAAAFAVACCIAVAVSVYTTAAYLLLGMRDEGRRR